MKFSFFKILSFLSLTFILLFFLCTFISPVVFIETWRLINAFLSDEVMFSLSLSVFTATCSTLISIIIGIPVAYALSRYEFRGKSIIDGFLDVPAAVPPIALGVMLLIFFSRNPLGVLINEKLVKFVFEVPGIILAQFAVISIFTIRLLKASFDGIPVRYEKIARTLGYSELESFFYVTLPAAWRGIFSAALLSWAKALGEFGATVTLAGATRFKTETLSIALYLNLAAADLSGVVAVLFILLSTACTTLVIVRRVLARGFIVC